jgi:hypothetical protein
MNTEQGTRNNEVGILRCTLIRVHLLDIPCFGRLFFYLFFLFFHLHHSLFLVQYSFHLPITFISVRLFFPRPSSVLLSAVGFVSPYPLATRR